MDNTSRLLLVGLIASVVVFGVSMAWVLDHDPQTVDAASNKGHFTFVLSDSLGNVQQIKQFDNAVLNTGENCIAKMIFGSDGGDQVGDVVCTGQISEGYRYLCLGEDAQIYSTDEDLRDPADSAGLSTCQKGSITWNQNSTGGSAALSKVTVRISSTFTNGGADETISMAGLANATSQATRSFLAMGNDTATLITSGSDLTVHYDFEYGGGTVP